MTTIELTESESLDLVSHALVGRIVTTVDGSPQIHPVSHTVIDGAIYFRTLPGDKLLGVTVNASVLFEADAIANGTAWSVVVHGLARRIDEEPEVMSQVASLLREPFTGGSPEAVVRIVPQSVNGRLFPPSPDSRDRDSAQRG